MSPSLGDSPHDQTCLLTHHPLDNQDCSTPSGNSKAWPDLYAPPHCNAMHSNQDIHSMHSSVKHERHELSGSAKRMPSSACSW
jgi:hypothetical protein